MASLATLFRASARHGRATVRGLSMSARCLAAQNFTMPALSPTMTEGSIASWKVKDGESFSAGDVLLEIETDKATMDVEAQGDGIMMKIMAEAGSKAIQVGSRIAVVADPGDDISVLEIPATEQPPASQTDASAAAPVAQERNAEPQPTNRPQHGGDGNTHSLKHPLIPAVEHLVRQYHLVEDDLRRITSTGPSGRLLKGDVLAYLGTIQADAPATISSRLEKLSHLDLSNIKPASAPTKRAVSAQPAAAPAPVPVPQPLKINVPVSLAKVFEVQKKMQDTLGVFVPLSVFISRAADVANKNLPLTTSRAPTSDELFDKVLGLEKLSSTVRGSRGAYMPRVSAVPPASTAGAAPPRPPSRPPDIIDLLTASARKPARKLSSAVPSLPGLSSGANIFTLVVPKDEAKRAEIFLERCKLTLENEPGRLIL